MTNVSYVFFRTPAWEIILTNPHEYPYKYLETALINVEEFQSLLNRSDFDIKQFVVTKDR